MDFQIFYMQYVHYLQRKYSLSSFNLLGHTAPAQAGSLLLLGPFLDYWLTNNRVDQYAYATPSVVSSKFCLTERVQRYQIKQIAPRWYSSRKMSLRFCRTRRICHWLICVTLFFTNQFLWCDWQMFIVLSCTIAVGTNLSQFICIGRFSAVSFQVLGHMKTILVLIMGFFFFGREGLNLHVIVGMIIAVVGMMWYGNASSKPGGKERWSHSLPTNKTESRS